MKIGGLILAGGQGQRVNNQNKGLLLLKGKPLIEYVIKNLSNYVDYLAISANKQLAKYQSYHLPIFADTAEFKEMGPLAGIISASRYFPKELDAIQVVPCDTPFLPRDLVPKLAKALFADNKIQLAYAATQQCIHPSIFLFRPAINEHLAAHLNAGKRSLKSWIYSHQYREVLFTDEKAFTNINHLSTLAHFNEED